MKQNDLPTLNAPPGAGVPRARSEVVPEGTPGARPTRSRAPAPDAARGMPAASVERGPDLMLPANAARSASVPQSEALYEADRKDDEAQDSADAQTNAERKRKSLEQDKEQARRDAERDPVRQALLIQDEAANKAQPVSMLMIDPADDGPSPFQSEERMRTGKIRKRAREAAAAMAGGDASEIMAPEESGDRLHRIAVVAHMWLQDLRKPRMKGGSSLPALAPKSRAECERRCGHSGFCDPADPYGCGGVHCGRARDVLY